MSSTTVRTLGGIILLTVILVITSKPHAQSPSGWFLMVPPAVPERFPPLPPTGKAIVLTTAPLKDWWKTPPRNPYLFYTRDACETGLKKLLALGPPPNETEEVRRTIRTQNSFARCIASDDPALR